MGLGEDELDPTAHSMLQLLTRGGASAVVLRGDERRAAYVSENAAEVLGWDAEAVHTLGGSIIHPDDMGRYLEIARQAREEGLPYVSMRGRVRDQAGTYRWFEIEGHRFVHPPIPGVISVLTPIVDHSPRSEESRHRDRLATILDLGVELHAVVDADFDFRFISSSVRTLLGHRIDDFRSHIREIVDPDDWRCALDAMRGLTDEGASATEHVRVTAVDGTRRTLAVTITNRLSNPAVEGFVLSAHDVTDLVATQAREAQALRSLEAILANASDGVVLADDRGIVAFASLRVQTLFGFTPDEVVGRSMLDFVHESDLPVATRALERLARDEAQPKAILRIRRADGGSEWVEVVGNNQLDTPDLRAFVFGLRLVEASDGSSAIVDAVLRATNAAVCTANDRRHITWSGPGVSSILGTPIDDLSRDSLRVWFDEGGAAAVDAEINRILGGTRGERATVLAITRRDRRWCEITIQDAVDDPVLRGVVFSAVDVSDRVESALAGQRLTAVLEATTDLVSIFDPSGRILWANEAMLTRTGMALGDSVFDTLPTWVLETIDEVVIPSLEEEQTWRGELELVIDDVEVVHDVTFVAHAGPDGDMLFISAIARDMTEHKAMEDRLHEQSRHDGLTGLPNRVRLVESLTNSLSAGDQVAVIFCDLDQFKYVNDSRGHDVGDRLLLALARRLRGGLRAGDVVARFGGDEFVVVLHGIEDIDQAHARAIQLLDHARGQTRLGELEVFITLSAGVALSTPEDDQATLIAKADSAMYEAKRRGRDQVAVYDDRLREATATRLSMVRELRTAIDRGELRIWFQPMVSTITGRPEAVEALARWEHPTRGLVGPTGFVEVAEETGLIIPLGNTLLRLAFSEMALLGEDAHGLTLTVNISARQLGDPHLAEELSSVASEFGINPAQVLLEITETTAMADVEVTLTTLGILRQRGFRIAIDDFGTGYSSLAYLQRLPVDLLKIDRSFIVALDPYDKGSIAFVDAIIGLAHSLDIRVVAEGVESAEQLELLTELGCDFVQGYHLAPPVPPEVVGESVAEIRRFGRVGRRPS